MPTTTPPWCVLDSTTTPAVMRCKHCHTELPMRFPMDILVLKGTCDVFLYTHALCYLTIADLQSKLERMDNRDHSPRGWARASMERQRVQDTISRKRAAHRAKRAGEPT